MKNFIILIIIAAACLVGYNYFTTGEITLIPGAALSEEEQQVKDLKDRFYTARRMVIQAQRSSGVGGFAGVNTVDPEMGEIDRVESQLATLMDTLESDSAWDDAERLQREIVNFRGEIQ
jgi:hypothetical protein